VRVLRGPWAAWDVADSAVAIGVFDGVHRGHAAVLREITHSPHLPVVLTFDPHPLAVLAPERAPAMLTSLQRRIDLFAEAGVAVTAVLTFDDEVRSMSPEAFSLEVLTGGLDARRVVVGADFHFGKDRSGTPGVLRDLGDRYGFEVTVMPLVGDDVGVSSSGIRAAVAHGRVEEAAAGLGRRYRVVGTVVAGDGRGVDLGFPTANLEVAPGAAIPGRGVYAVVGGLLQGEVNGVANIGVRPTFGGRHQEVVEVHFLDFDGDLYGEQIAIDFVTRIRDERTFGGVEELVDQIGRDVAAARVIHTP
jgi:riboflavin kinase/FMN adenylyltransferase